MMNNFRVYLILIVAGVSYFAADGCDKHKLNLAIKDFKDDNCIKLINPKVKLTKDCFIQVAGCVTITKKLTTCQVIYDFKKTNMVVPFKGERNMCEEIEKLKKDPEAQKKLKETNMDPKCPFDPVENMCAPDGSKTSVEQYKNKFKLILGKYNGTIDINCDACASAYNVEIDFKKG